MKNIKRNGLLKSVEGHFAAAGLAEGDPEIARDFIEKNNLVSNRFGLQWAKGFFETMENSFVAAGLAEGDLETARHYIHQREPHQSWLARFTEKVKKIHTSFEQTFAAAALAEGSLDMARDHLEVKDAAPESFDQFLDMVGLKGIRFQYGIAVV